jgi:hypothetical protein
MANGGTHWWDQGQEQLRRERKAVQFQAIKEALGPEVRIFPDDDDPGGAQYLYKDRIVLTRAQNADEVLGELGLTDQNRSDDDPVPGVTTITVPQGNQWADHKAVFDHLDQRFGPGFAMPDFVVHITTTGGCPAIEPIPWPDVVPDPPLSADANAGDDKTLIVLDSGVRQDVVNDHSWLKDVDGVAEQPGQVGNVYQGHGTFVAGVARTMAPKVGVEVRSLGYRHGALLESSFAPLLSKALDDSPDIINMSAGVSTRNGKPPIALRLVCDRLADPAVKSVLVASAGNDMTSDPFFPAALPHVVSVGALDASRKRAGYSNWGPWVQVYAQGSDLANAYPKGAHNYGEPPYGQGAHAHFDKGMAQWSGTSFSAPLVAGLIAARMTKHAETAKQAWASLLAKAATQVGGDSGPRLFPGDEV